ALVDEEGREVPICNLEEFNSVQLSDGDCLTFYADTGRLEEELLRVAPEDRRRIQRFIRDLRSMARLKIPIDTEKWGKKEWFLFLLKHMGPALKLREYSRLTFEAFTRPSMNETLQDAFRTLMPPDCTATAVV